MKGKLRRLTEIPLARYLNEAADHLGGYRTAGQVELPELGLPDGHGQPYVPSDWFALRRTVDGLVVRPGDAFLDYGSGKGRVLFAAARRPFARLIGIDLSPELVETARSNLTGHGRLAGREVVLEVADAARYDVPDDVSVAYLFCPFTGPTFAAVVERVLASIDRRPRPLLVVYMAPFEHNYLVATQRIRPVASAPSRWPPRRLAPGEAIVTYAVRPDGGDFPDPEQLIRRPQFHDDRWKGFTAPVVRLGPEFAGAPLMPVSGG